MLIKISFVQDWELLARGADLFRRYGRRGGAYGSWFGVTFGLVCLFASALSLALKGPVWVGVLLIVTGVLQYLRLLPFESLFYRWQYKKAIRSPRQCEVQISKSGIKTTSPDSRSELSWNLFKRMVVDDVTVVFVTENGLAVVFPSAAFGEPGSISELTAFVEKNGISLLDIRKVRS